MMSNGLFFLVLSLIYLFQDGVLYIRFRNKYGLGLSSGNPTRGEWRYWYVLTIYLVSFYYSLVLIYAAFNFDFWGLISPIHLLNRPLFYGAGFVFGMFFLAGIAVSRLHLGASWRLGVDVNSSAELVTGGIYRIVRHPYFVALLGFEASLFFVLPNAITLLAFLQSFIAVNYQADLEERFLAAHYGEAYTVYSKNSGRFFPRCRGRHASPY